MGKIYVTIISDEDRVVREVKTHQTLEQAKDYAHLSYETTCYACCWKVQIYETEAPWL